MTAPKNIDVINDCDYKDALVDVLQRVSLHKEKVLHIQEKTYALTLLRRSVYKYDRVITFSANCMTDEIGLAELYDIAAIAIRAIVEVNHLE